MTLNISNIYLQGPPSITKLCIEFFNNMILHVNILYVIMPNYVR